jgi:hypothetical protein
LAEVKAKQIIGELVEVSEVETFWRSKLKAFRNCIPRHPVPLQGPVGAAERDLDARASSPRSSSLSMISSGDVCRGEKEDGTV